MLRLRAPLELGWRYCDGCHRCEGCRTLTGNGRGGIGRGGGRGGFGRGGGGGRGGGRGRGGGGGRSSLSYRGRGSNCAHRLRLLRGHVFAGLIGVHVCIATIGEAPPWASRFINRLHGDNSAERLKGLLTLRCRGDGHQTF